MVAPVTIGVLPDFIERSMTQHLRGIAALVVVVLVWGTTFPAMKELTAYFSPVWIIVTRFAIATVLLSPFLWRARRTDVMLGGILGLLLFFCTKPILKVDLELAVLRAKNIDAARRSSDTLCNGIYVRNL